MLIEIIRYLKGYVVIRVCGFSPERFLNLCSSNHILVWDIENRKTCYEMKMSIRGFKKIRPFARKTKTKIMILEKHGLPFFVFRSRKRKAFFLGALGCAFLLWFLSLFIWDIRIEGCVQYTEDVLMDFLEENDVLHGMPKSRVDGEKIQFLLRGAYPKITWASVSVEGTRLLVEIRENTVTDEEIFTENIGKDLSPRDLVSPAAGTIKRMIVRRGTPLKRVGDTVEPGEVLVSGRLEIRNDSQEVAAYEYCAADADIAIEYELPYESRLERVYTRRVYTGNVRRGFFLKTGAASLSFSQNPAEFDRWDSVSVQHQLRLLDNFYIPVYFGSRIFREYRTAAASHTDEELETLLLERLDLYFGDLEKKGVQITENNVKIQIDENGAVAVGTLIAEQEKLDSIPTEQLPDPMQPEAETM